MEWKKKIPDLYGLRPNTKAWRAIGSNEILNLLRLTFPLKHKMSVYMFDCIVVKFVVMLLQVTQSQQVSDNVDETYPFNLQ